MFLQYYGFAVSPPHANSEVEYWILNHSDTSKAIFPFDWHHKKKYHRGLGDIAQMAPFTLKL